MRRRRGVAIEAQSLRPAVDVRADDDEIVFECDVPGMKADDLEVTIQNHVVCIQGARKLEASDASQRVLLGRAYGSFQWTYAPPEGVVDEAHMTASLANGVLTVTVPKLPQAKPRRISIGGAPKNQLER